MLKTVVVYEGESHEMPIIESREPAVAVSVVEAALREFAESLNRCEDPVLHEIIAAEMDQARRVLSAAGLRVPGEPAEDE